MGAGGQRANSTNMKSAMVPLGALRATMTSAGVPWTLALGMARFQTEALPVAGPALMVVETRGGESGESLWMETVASPPWTQPWSWIKEKSW